MQKQYIKQHDIAAITVPTWGWVMAVSPRQVIRFMQLLEFEPRLGPISWDGISYEPIRHPQEVKPALIEAGRLLAFK